MASESPGVRFHDAVQGARHLIERIREDGSMRDTDFKFDFYQPCTRSARREANQLDKFIDAIVKARFDDAPTNLADNSRVQDDTGKKEEIPF